MHPHSSQCAAAKANATLKKRLSCFEEALEQLTLVGVHFIKVKTKD
jgi:hypothetical protein